MAPRSNVTTTLVVMWLFTCLAMVLMILRLMMRRVRRQRFQTSDYVTIAAMVFIVARCILDHLVLLFGTNNITLEFRAMYVFPPEEISQRETGSKLALAARSVHCTYIWLQKVVVVLLYQRLLSGLSWAQYALPVYWATLAAFYIIAQIVTFLECDPFYLYWQVSPDPGTCTEALIQLSVFGALSIFTDIMLIILPMPTLFKIHRSTARRVYLMFLFSVGLLVIATTTTRLTLTYLNPNNLIFHSILVSSEAFAAAIVANTPTLYTLRSKKSSPLSFITTVTEITGAANSPVSQRKTGNSSWPSTKRRRQTTPSLRDGLSPTIFQEMAPRETISPYPGTRNQWRLTLSPRSWGTPTPSNQGTPDTPRDSIEIVGLGVQTRMREHSSPPLPPGTRSMQSPGAIGSDSGNRGGSRGMGWPLPERGLPVRPPTVELASYFDHDDEEGGRQKRKLLRFA